MSKKEGKGGGISNPKNFIANLRRLMHIYKFLQKKAQCNFQKWGWGGGQRPFGSFPKKHPVWEIQSPLIYNHPAAQSAVTAQAITPLLARRVERIMVRLKRLRECLDFFMRFIWTNNSEHTFENVNFFHLEPRF